MPIFVTQLIFTLYMSLLISKHEPIILVFICLDNYSINERDCKCCLEIYLFNELKAAIFDCSLTVQKLNNNTQKQANKATFPGIVRRLAEDTFTFHNPRGTSADSGSGGKLRIHQDLVGTIIVTNCNNYAWFSLNSFHSFTTNRTFDMNTVLIDIRVTLSSFEVNVSSVHPPS